MARTVLAVQTIDRSGGAHTYSAFSIPADGHAFDNTTGKVFIHIKNGGASPITLSVDTPKSVDGIAVPTKDFTIPATGERIIGPFPKSIYNQANATLGLTEAVHINVSANTSVTVAALKLSGS